MAASVCRPRRGGARPPPKSATVSFHCFQRVLSIFIGVSHSASRLDEETLLQLFIRITARSTPKVIERKQ